MESVSSCILSVIHAEHCIFLRRFSAKSIQQCDKVGHHSMIPKHGHTSDSKKVFTDNATIPPMHEWSKRERYAEERFTQRCTILTSYLRGEGQ